MNFFNTSLRAQKRTDAKHLENVYQQFMLALMMIDERFKNIF